MIIQALQRLGPANDHSGTAGECWPLLLSTELTEGFFTIFREGLYHGILLVESPYKLEVSKC